MTLSALRVYWRIALPFTLLGVGVTVVTAVLAMSIVSSTMERRFLRRVERASQMVADSGFAANGPILERLKLVLDSDVVTYARNGDVVASTLPGDGGGLARRVAAPDLADAVTAGGRALLLHDVSHDGRRYTVAYRPVHSPPDLVLAFIVPTADIDAARRNTATLIAAGAAVMVAVVLVASHLVARTITAPVEQLADLTRRFAAGERGLRATVGRHDELGALAQAFNDMAERLRESEERLLRSERMAAAGRLAAGVAHDIRNPLSSLKMQVQLLRARLLQGHAAPELVAPILREVDRVEWVVSGLLDLARPGQLDRQPAAINEVVERALGVMEPQLLHRKIVIDRRLAPDLPPVLLDAGRMAHTLVNLIVNAADAMPDGGTVTVTTAETEGGSAVRIEVADEGEGVDEAVRSRLFEPFVTGKRDGVGLGLPNARHVVEMHGGSIELRERAGGGTCAAVTLPVTARGG